MAMLMDTPVARKRRAGVRKLKRHSLKTDMTPLVDLGFLLISFFIITTELTCPKVVNLNMPHDGPPMDLGVSNALTVLVDRDNILFYYERSWEEAVKTGSIIKTTFNRHGGLGDVIRKKQKSLGTKSQGEGRKGLMLLIKPSERSSYKNVMNALDEALINDVKKYAIVKLEKEELRYLYDH